MNFNKEKYKKYLPSKSFIIIAIFVMVLVIIIYAIFFMSSSGEKFILGEKNNIPLKIENQTISELIQADTDKDGIADWEEALWGTDKYKKITFNDIPDATYIENKKKELRIESDINEKKLTETEKFAREFFASYTALKSSDQIDDETINNFSSALGQKIVNPNLIDLYTETDIKISNDNSAAVQQTYYLSMKTLFNSYKSFGLGSELDIITKGLTTNNTNDLDQYEKLNTIGKAYQDFAKKIIAISVPISLSDYHLRIANSSNNTGLSVLSMNKIISDPIIGLSGLSQYQKYSDDLIKAVTELEAALIKE